MSTSPVFEWLSAELSTHARFDVLNSRGTLRLALQSAGLEPRTLTKEQAEVVIARVLPQDLKLRGVTDATNVCMRISMALKLMRFAQTAPDSAETTFARLGRKQ
jgi:hypothetical protein